MQPNQPARKPTSSSARASTCRISSRPAAPWIVSRTRTSALLAAHARPDEALTGGFQHALLACAFFLLAAALTGLRATNTRGEPTGPPDDIHVGHERIPAPELTD